VRFADVASTSLSAEEMPWLAVPYEDRKTKEALDRRLKIAGPFCTYLLLVSDRPSRCVRVHLFPDLTTLVLLWSNGTVITNEGRMNVGLDAAVSCIVWGSSHLILSDSMLGRCACVNRARSSRGCRCR
jgi:hypothetical protein